MCSLSLIVLLIHITGHKFIAKKYGCDSIYSVWSFKRVWFWGWAALSYAIYAGIIFPLLVTILSNGQLYLALTGVSTIIVNKAYRIGRKYTRLTDIENAKIALAGPMATILFALIIKIFSNGNEILNQLVFISWVMSISYMIPLPKIDGAEIFMGSQLTYIFGLAFIIGCITLLYWLNIFSTIILAIIFALIAVFTYYYYYIYQ